MANHKIMAGSCGKRSCSGGTVKTNRPSAPSKPSTENRGDAATPSKK